MNRKNAKIDTIEEVRNYAMQNYNNGGDGIVECYDDAQIEEIILTPCRKSGRSVRNFLDNMFTTFRQTEHERENIEIADKLEEFNAKPKKRYPRTRRSEMTEVGDVRLTPRQVVFLRTMPCDDFYENGVDSVLWVDVFLETLQAKADMGAMVAGAMVSTLNEKNLISVGKERKEGKTVAFFSLTDKGKEVMQGLGIDNPEAAKAARLLRNKLDMMVSKTQSGWLVDGEPMTNAEVIEASLMSL